MKKILFLLLAALFAMQGWGQTFLSENFNGGSMPSTFTLVNGVCGWVVTENGSSTYWSVPAGNGYYAIINDDACGNWQNNSNVWMKLPSMDLSSTTALSLNFNSCVYNTSGDIALVKVSIDGGSTWIGHAVPNGSGSAWVPVTIDLTAYCGNANVIVAFYYSDLGDWFYGWAVDDIVIAAPPLANDLTAVSLSPYNMVTGQAQVPYFTLKNSGLTAVTSSDYTIQLTDGGLYTQTISGVDLAIGQNTTIAFPAYTAATLGAMALTATITYAADLYAADNTITSIGQVYDLPVYDYNAYALNTTNGTYYSFDVYTSALTSVGTGISSASFPRSETWVGDKIARVYLDGSFGYVLANGTFVKIGDLISPIEAPPISLAYDRTNSILYVLGVGASNTAYLGTVDLTSLEVAAIGNTNNTQLIIGIDFADDGYLYGPALGNNKLYKIAPSDATTTEIGNVGVDLNYGQDVAYDYVTHKLYSYAYVNGVGVKYGYYNLNTGAFIEIAPIAVDGQYACITIITNTLLPCYQVTGVTPSELTASTATISWFPPENIPSNGYEYRLSTSATASTDSTTTGTVNDTVVYLQALMPNTTYYIWVRSNCGSEVSAWSNFVATFTTPATCPTPTGLTLASANTAAGEATLSWDALGAAGWNIKVSSTVLTNPENETADIENAGTATGTPQFLVTSLTMGSTYYYYIQSDCGSPWANHSFFFDYCTPAPSTNGADGGGITNVSFGGTLTVNNTTGAEAGDYGNYSSMVGTAVRGFDLTVAITYSTGYTYGTKIWIDTNQNLIFDANELLYTGLSTNVSPTTLIATIPIPASLPLGNYRMRIGGTDNETSPNGPWPCNIGTYGCMEDYTVQVIEPLNLDDDLWVVAVNVYDMFVGNTQIPKVTIRNNGLNAAMDGTYSIMLTDGAAYSQTVTGVTLNSGTNTVFSFPALAYTTASAHTLTATIIYGVDLFDANDTLSANITVYNVPIYPYNAYLTNYIGSSTANFHSFDVFTSANTLIGPAGSGPTPMSDVWVGTGNTGQGDGKIARILNDNSFGYVLENGTFVKTGNLVMPGTVSSATARSLAYNRTTNVLYILLRGSNNTSYLGEVNLQTLEVTLIGNTNNIQRIEGIDLANDGYLYGPALNDDKLYKIDPATAVTTEIGATGLDLEYAQDCAFDYVTNKLYSYAFDYTNSVASIHYGYYDLATGAFTEIAPCPDLFEVLTEVIIHNTLPSCMQVVNVQASNITANTATVTWNTPDVAPAAGYEYYLSTSSTRPAESEPATGTVSDTAVEFSSLTPATTYYVWVRSLCSDTEVSIWNHYPGNFTTLCYDGAITTFPWTEGFEAGLQCWSQESSSGSVTWTNPAYYYSSTSPGVPPAEGTSIAYLFEGQNATRHWTKLISPVLDLTGLAEPYLVYKHIQQIWFSDQDHLTVYYRTSATDTWTELQTFTSNIPAWQQDSIALPNPSATYQIAFDGGVAWGYGVGLDAITVSGAVVVSCSAPTALTPTLTYTAATITWTAGDAETQWQVAWKEAAASAWGNPVGVAATTYYISGLTAASNYNVIVRAICGEANTSDWSGAITFTTLTCLDPTNTTTTAITANSITVTWQPMNGETDWKVSWKNMGTGAWGSGDAHNNDNEGYSIIDLVANTKYQICVTAVCAESVESDPNNCIFASTSGIHDLTLANSLQLYPNPTTGELKIKNYKLREGDKIEIYNMLGQKQQLTTNHYPLSTINVSHLSAGIYTVKIGGYVGKFVKK